MIVDQATSERIGAAWLRAALAPVGDFGRRADDTFTPFRPGDERAAQTTCASIVSLAQSLESEGVPRIRAALRRAPDVQPLMARARAGDMLADVDVYEIGRFVDAVAACAQAWDAAGGSAHDRPPTLEALSAVLAPGREGTGFYLADAFDAALAPMRAAYAEADARVQRERERLGALLAETLGFVPDGEEFIAMRDAVPNVPLGVRVVRETPAYRTLALELDPSSLAAAQACDAALTALAEVEASARRVLSEKIGPHAEAVEAASRALGTLDWTLARVAFTQRWSGCVPAFCPDRLEFSEATFAPLAETLANAGLPYTPLALELAGVAALTGPNMGGKSAALATCGFLALCCAHGVPPPAVSYSAPLFAHVAWIGERSDADDSRLLSSFGAEVARARDVLAFEERPELFLIDEFARTTGAREGRALTISLLEALARRGAYALAATHAEGIASEAGIAHFAIAGLADRTLEAHAARDLHAALDAVSRAMDYRIVRLEHDAQPASDALALARLLGLDAAIVERAGEIFAASEHATGA